MRITGIIPNHILEKMNPKDRPKGPEGLTVREVYERASKRAEKEIQEEIANYLRQRNIPFQRTRMDKKTTGTIGWPDFTFPFDGKFYGLEVKARGCGETTEQSYCLGMIRDCGGVAFVVHSVQEVVNLLLRPIYP